MNKLIAILLIIIIIPSVFGLGISPGKRTFDFEKGGAKTVDLTVHNNDNNNFDCIIQARGELSEYIELSHEKLHFDSNDETKKFTYKINFPENFDTPGVHSGEIVVKEMLKDEKSDEVVIKPGLMMVSKIYVTVPYPSKYAKAEIITDNVKRGDSLEVFIRFSNVGSEIIDNATAVIYVLSPNDKELIKLNSNSISVEPKKTRELIAQFDTTELGPGDYKLKADITYDGQETQAVGSFTIDDFLIKMLSVAVDSFNIGEIADFDITLQNIGNRLVEGVNAGLFLKDKSGKTVADINSYKISMSPGDVKETKIFWDTKDIKTGNYYGSLSIKYDNEKLTKDVVTIVKDDDIDVKFGNSLTGYMVTEGDIKESNEKNMSWMIMLVVIVILLLLLIIQAFRGKSGKNN